MNNQSSSKDSMPNEYVDEKSAAENSVTDQHVPDATNPVAAIGEAVGAVAGEFIITETPITIEDLGHHRFHRFQRQYRRAGSDVLVKVEYMFNGSVSKIEFGPGATDEDLAVDRSDPSYVHMAKFLERERRKSPEQKEREDEELSARVDAEVKKHEEAVRARIEAKEAAAANARKERDIVKRAKALETEIQFKDVKKIRHGDMYIPQPQMTDQNKMVVLEALFKGEYDRPHRDLFLGRIVDHEGYIIDDHYPVHEWIEAFAAAGLKGVSAKAAREILREWALKREFERNDLIEHVKRKMPEWDGKKRMAASLVELFKCDETELNREFSEYFWLSLYSRVMYPGSQAPVVLSLFGAQNCGKSYFGKRLARIITGNPNADSVQLNLAGDRLDFLRSITGFSVIASVGEMTGFTRGDLNKIKDFVTRTNDMLHYKFEGTFNQPRQFIIVMDGNKYEGLQRDDSGNRRFYPMFCGRLPDQDGQPRWSEDFNAGPTIHSDEFEADVWQIMAECAEWFDDNGEEGYNRLVGDVSSKVSVFNGVERAANRGTIHDPDVEAFLIDAIIRSEKRLIRKRDGSGRVGVAIRQSDLIIAFKDVSQVRNPNHRHIALAMKALHADEQKTQNRLAYYFDGHESIEAFEQFISGESDHEVVESQPMKRKSEEF